MLVHGKYLEVLSAYGNKLVSLPAEIGYCRNLEEIFLAQNQLTSLPEELFTLSQLRVLSVRGNNITMISESIANLKCLKVLEVDRNGLKTLPTGLKSLPRLETLSIRENLLTDVNIIASLPSLRILNASSNQIARLPDDFGPCTTTLSALYVGANKLTALPASILSLPQLEALDIRNNADLKPERLRLPCSCEEILHIVRDSLPNATVVANTYLSGPHATECVLGEKCTLTLHACDTHKMQRISGGDTWSITFQQAGAPPRSITPLLLEVEDKHNGSYHITYKLPSSLSHGRLQLLIQAGQERVIKPLFVRHGAENVASSAEEAAQLWEERWMALMDAVKEMLAAKGENQESKETAPEGQLEGELQLGQLEAAVREAHHTSLFYAAELRALEIAAEEKAMDQEEG